MARTTRPIQARHRRTEAGSSRRGTTTASLTRPPSIAQLLGVQTECIAVLQHAVQQLQERLPSPARVAFTDADIYRRCRQQR